MGGSLEMVRKSEKHWIQPDHGTFEWNNLDLNIDMGVEPKIGGFFPPKWMVKIMEKPIKNGWFGGTIIFGNTHIAYLWLNSFWKWEKTQVSTESVLYHLDKGSESWKFPCRYSRSPWWCICDLRSTSVDLPQSINPPQKKAVIKNHWLLYGCI